MEHDQQTPGDGDEPLGADEPMGNDFFAPPPFKADEALVQLRRSLRDQRALTERGGVYLFEGHEVLSLEAQGSTITARLARAPARTPQWDTQICRHAADVRKLQDELKRRLARWTED